MSFACEAASLAPTLLARKGAAEPWSRAHASYLSSGSSVTRLPISANTSPKKGGKTPGGDNGPRRRVSMRVDEARHLQLRLIAAHYEKSQQALLVAAFDEFVARHAGGCLCLGGATEFSGADDDRARHPTL